MIKGGQREFSHRFTFPLRPKSYIDISNVVLTGRDWLKLYDLSEVDKTRLS
jgi:hypothetical protein